MNSSNTSTRAALYGNKQDRGAQLFVMSANDGSPIAFKKVIALARERKIINFAGGCKGLDDTTRQAMFDFVAQALTREDGTRYAGVVMSGGTKDAKAMVTQLPSYIAAQEGFEVVAVAHTPKTDNLSLQGEAAELKLNDYGTTLDTGHHALLVCQPDVNTSGDWDYDVPTYREIMSQILAEDGRAVNVVINGGDITRDGEIYGVLQEGIAVIVVEGSGREADAFVAAFRDGDWSKTAAELRAKKGDEKADAKVKACQEILAGIDRDLVYIAKMNDVASLRAGFVKFGIL